MAIVKFISESDCQLFIDMEYVCDIYANKMHKVSLDAGSYLVEAKDIHGNTLNKYELKISPSEAQVLQCLSNKKSSVNDTILKLKNDSSLRFYNQRAVLKYNEQYGYINSQYKIVIPPEYSYAEDFIEERTLVKKVFPDREMATVIDTDGNICFGGWFEYIGSDSNTILLKDNQQFFVVSRCGFLITNKYYDAGYDGENQLIPVYKEIGVDDMYGFIDKMGNEIVPLIYDNVWNFDESGYAKVKRFGHIHEVDYSGNLYKYNHSNEMLTREESLIKGFNYDGNIMPYKKGALWLVEKVEEEWSTHSNRVALHECDKIFDIDSTIHYCWMTFRRGGICILAIFDEKKTCVAFDADSIKPFLFGDEGFIDYLIIKKNRKLGVANVNGNIIVPMEFDSITPIIRQEHTFMGSEDTFEINGFIINRGNKYGITNILGEIVLPIEYEEITPSEAMERNYTGDYAIIRKNGRCSLVYVPTGKIMFQSSFEDIIVKDTSNEYDSRDSTFLIKENGKYGFLTFNKRLLDSIYDEIIFECECKSFFDYNDRLYYIFTLHKDGKIGIYEYLYDYSDREEYSFYVEPIYDECILLYNRYAVVNQRGMYYVAVRRNDKWGILDIEPAYATYFPSSSCYWRDRPNLVDLEFKYFSIEELKQDADEEFERRFHKYYREHIVGPTGVITW